MFPFINAARPDGIKSEYIPVFWPRHGDGAQQSGAELEIQVVCSTAKTIEARLVQYLNAVKTRKHATVWVHHPEAQPLASVPGCHASPKVQHPIQQWLGNDNCPETCARILRSAAKRAHDGVDTEKVHAPQICEKIREAILEVRVRFYERLPTEEELAATSSAARAARNGRGIHQLHRSWQSRHGGAPHAGRVAFECESAGDIAVRVLLRLRRLHTRHGLACAGVEICACTLADPKLCVSRRGW